MSKIKNTLAALAACLALAPAPSRAEFLSAELMGGHGSSTIDVKVGAEIGERTGLFGRIRSTATYDGNTDTFCLADMTYNLVDGLNTLLEVQYAGEFIPRIGLQYMRSWGDFSLLAQSSASLREHTDGEFITFLRYSPSVSEDLHIATQTEFVTNIGSEGHNFSIQRLRFGLGVDHFEAGFAADLQEVGNEGEFSYNIGGYLSGMF